MVFWIVAALLTAGACLAVLIPWLRPSGTVNDTGEHDLEVYRDQLGEIERDGARGLISAEESQEARAEIARRILRAGGESRMSGAARPRIGRSGRLVATIALLSVPLVSWSVYALTGSPDYEGQPLQARLERSPNEASPDELIAQAEMHLAANPDDARGWSVLAPIYMRTGRYAEAEGAFRNSIRLDGPSAERWSGLGEAIAARNDGTITREARQAFEEARAIEPDSLRARYGLALASAQGGDLEAAETLWDGMAADVPPGSPWLGAIANARQAAALAPGDGARDEMIEGMVSGLAERLERAPQDLDGWQRLVRSYMVLQREGDATEALRRGVAALGTGTPEGSHLTAFGLSLGLSIE